jgi:rubredoxin
MDQILCPSCQIKTDSARARCQSCGYLLHVKWTAEQSKIEEGISIEKIKAKQAGRNVSQYRQPF